MFRLLAILVMGAGAIAPVFGSPAPPAVRLGVRQEGPCLLTFAELEAGLALPAGTAAAAIEARELALSCAGEPVAYDAVSNGLVFLGRANDSVDSSETAYLLERAPGLAVEGDDHSADGVEAAVLPVGTIEKTLHLETNNWCSILLDSRPGAGWMVWQLLTPGSTLSIPCAMPGYAGGTNVQLTVSLRSLHPESGIDEHRFDVGWNSQVLGTASWSGQQAALWQGALPAGAASGPSGGTVTVTETTGATAGRGALDWVEIRYPAPALAEAGRLLWTAGDDNPIVLAGFPGEPRVWDVTDPARPRRLDGLAPVARDGGFACGFTPVAGRRYAAFSASGLRPPAWQRADESADLSASTNAADWVVILPPLALADFRAGGQWLADFRAAQGLRTRVLTAEALADTFGGGLLSTGAISRFARATAGWSVRPASLLLLGYGSVDYRHESTRSVCLLPTPAVPMVFGVGDRMGEIVSADASYGDDDGDGVPEVVIGRIPVQTEAELAVALDKIVHFEEAAVGKSNALFTADNPTNGVSATINLHASSDGMAADAAAGGFTPVKVYVAATQLTSRVIRPPVMAALSNGPSFFLHLGHGDAGQIGWGSAGNGILVNTLIGGSQTWGWPAVGLFPSCQINRFHHPSYPDTFCLEAWRRPGAGFSAIWAPSCKVTDFDGILLGREIVRAWAGDAPLRLGEAVRLATSRARGNLQFPPVLPCITLLGDPATVIRLGRSARDTPDAWLRSKGLAQPNAEEGDADGDSFPAWAEYRLGTDPLSRGDHPLRIKGLAPATGRLELHFASGPGSRYRILRAGRPDQAWLPAPMALSASGEWLPSGDWMTATGLETTVCVPSEAGAQFFKVEAAP